MFQKKVWHIRARGGFSGAFQFFEPLSINNKRGKFHRCLLKLDMRADTQLKQKYGERKIFIK